MHKCDRAHFEGIHALDVANAPGDGDRRIYLSGYLSSIGVSEDRLEATIDRLIPLWMGPSLDLWRRILSGSDRWIAESYNADLRLGIVSNSDGLVEEELVDLPRDPEKACRSERFTIDSGVVGVAKPDPTIFDFVLPLLGWDSFLRHLRG